MKKIVTIMLCAIMMFTLSACGNEKNEAVTSGETIVLTTRNGAGETIEVEFPKNPERLAVMDLGALDILDNIGCGDKIVGVSSGSSIDYLQSYLTNEDIFNLGSIKEADLEAVLEAEPDVIFIGGRLSAMYDELVKIAPVYIVYTDESLGAVESTAMNARNIASMFGLEDKVAESMNEYASRVEALQTIAKDRTAIVGMVNAGGFALLGNDGRCSIIGNEIGFRNVGVAKENETSSHGNEASFEYVLEVNPEYIFVLDRDAAIGTEGAQLAAEVMDNELVNKTNAAKNGNVIVLEHSNIWYTAENGITALGIMLSDLESVLQ